jgi:hypothetical protein
MKVRDLSLSLLVVIVILIIYLLGKFFWSRRKIYSCAAQMSGPAAFPLIGNSLRYFCRKEGK